MHIPCFQGSEDIQITRGVLRIKLAHPRMCIRYTEISHIRKHRASRCLINDESLRPFKISRHLLMSHTDPEPLIYIEEMKVDILQRFIIGLERLDELSVAVQKLLRYEGVHHFLQHYAPFCRVRSRVRGPQEDDSVGRDVYFSVLVRVSASEVVR